MSENGTAEIPTAEINGQPDQNLTGSFLKSAKNILKQEKIETPVEKSKKSKPVAEKKVETTEEQNEKTPSIEPEKASEKDTNQVATPTNEKVVEEKKPEHPAEPAKKEWYEDESPSLVAPTNGQEKPKEEIDYKSKYSEVEPILNHPQIKAAITAIKAGKDIFSLAKEIQGADPSQMTPTQKYEWELKQSGISQNHIDAALENFSIKEEWEQELQTKPIEAKMIQQRNAKLEQYGIAEQQNEQVQAEQQKRTKAEYQNYINGLTDYNGVEITAERKAKLMEKFQNGIKDVYNSDGTPNVKALARIMILDEFEKNLVQVNVAKATNAGRKEVLDKVVRTNGNFTSDNRQVQTQDDKPTAESLVEKIIKSRQAAKTTA